MEYTRDDHKNMIMEMEVQEQERELQDELFYYLVALRIKSGEYEFRELILHLSKFDDSEVASNECADEFYSENDRIEVRPNVYKWEVGPFGEVGYEIESSKKLTRDEYNYLNKFI